MAFLSNNIYCLQIFNFNGQEDDQATYDLSYKTFMVNLDGRFFAVIVTPDPCPRRVCLMSVTKEIHVNC